MDDQEIQRRLNDHSRVAAVMRDWYTEKTTGSYNDKLKVRPFLEVVSDAISRPGFTVDELADAEQQPFVQHSDLGYFIRNNPQIGSQFNSGHASDDPESLAHLRKAIESLTTRPGNKCAAVREFLTNIAQEYIGGHFTNVHNHFTAACASDALARIDPSFSSSNNEGTIAYGAANAFKFAGPMEECVNFIENRILKPRTDPPTYLDFDRLNYFRGSIDNDSYKTRALFNLVEMGVSHPQLVSKDFFEKGFTPGNLDETQGKFAPLIEELKQLRRYLSPAEQGKLNRLDAKVLTVNHQLATHRRVLMAAAKAAQAQQLAAAQAAQKAALAQQQQAIANKKAISAAKRAKIKKALGGAITGVKNKALQVIKAAKHRFGNWRRKPARGQDFSR